MEKRSENRVGIMTFHRALNYGAALQSYALMIYLNDIGYETELIDFNPMKGKKDKKGFRRLLKRSTWRNMALERINDSYLKRRQADFYTFRNDYYRYGRMRDVGPDQIAEVSSEYSAVVCGSDQIWNPHTPDSSPLFFLPQGEGFKRVFYAASCGKGDLIEFAHPDEIRQALYRFDAVSVREKTTLKKLEDFCFLDKAPTVVCDPTLLLGAKPFLDIAGEMQVKEPYLFLYSVTGRDNTIRTAQTVAKRLNLPLYTMFSGKAKKCMSRMKSNIVPGDVGPLGFLAMMRDAEYIVTDSFHGSVLSLLFQKKFLIVQDQDHTGRPIRDERIGDLCGNFGIESRMITVDQADSADLACEIDWPKIEEKRKEMVQHAQKFLNDALVNDHDDFAAPESRDHVVCPPDICTGCEACVAGCPVHALSMSQQPDGRMIPSIDMSSCIHCNICRSTCPQVNPPVLHEPQECYAAQWNNAKRIESSSAGIGAAFAEYILSHEGIVFGAAVDDDLVVRHICVQNKKTLSRIRGSKYVHSENNGCYHEAEAFLKQGKIVAYFGTPCQIAGLRKYLGKEYQSLICIENICHGTPPMTYLKQHLKSHGYENATNYSFRGGLQDFRFKVFRNEEKLCDFAWWDDDYYSSFNYNITLSKNCYICPYAKYERCGDLTIGDFWKINRHTLKNQMDGRISLVLVNTEKGKSFWDSLAEDILSEKRTWEEASCGNPNLRKPTDASAVAYRFRADYAIHQDFQKAISTWPVKKVLLIGKFKHSGIWKIIKLGYKAVKKVL